MCLFPRYPGLRCVCQLTPLTGSPVEKMPNTDRCQQPGTLAAKYTPAWEQRSTDLLSFTCGCTCKNPSGGRPLLCFEKSSFHTSPQGPIFWHLTGWTPVCRRNIHEEGEQPSTFFSPGAQMSYEATPAMQNGSALQSHRHKRGGD